MVGERDREYRRRRSYWNQSSLPPGFVTHMHTVTVHLHKALSPKKTPIGALYYRPSVGLQTTGMQTGGTVRDGHPRQTSAPDIRAGHRGSQQPPQGPAWPWGNYLRDVIVFILCLLYPHLRLPT